jgi:pimeloyl-ACP methyl ester carboxylesterase
MWKATAAIVLALSMTAPTGSAALAAPATVAEQDISLKTPTGVLWGTLDAAASPSAPAVLILAGSGPTDRNGNGPTIHPDAYRLLAQGLTAHGLTTLRVDKRGVGESASAMGSEADLRFTTYADDAKAWATELKRRSGVKCVWLVGHSEGALVAEVAAQGNPDICGLVLVSGAGRKAGDILREQLAASPQLTPELKAAAAAAIAELEAGRTVTAPAALAALFRPSVQPYLISWLPLDPAALLARTRAPVLIVQGDNDLQIQVADAKRLASARPGASLTVIPGMNHVLKIAPADRAGNFATYGDPNLPLAPGVADGIAGFIAGHAG